MTLDLSIIIVAYNNRELLKNCLDSIYENIRAAVSFEIIVIDNNSQDNTLQLLQEFYPLVKVIDNLENVGFARANNQGLKIAKGKYLVLLNNDTFVLGECFENLLKFMDEHPEIGAISPKLLNADGLTVQKQGSALNSKIWKATKPSEVQFISGACFLIRREVYKNVGGLDEKFFFYNEDLDWCKRITSYGWKIYYYPGSAVIHFGGKSTGFIGHRAIVEGLKGGLYFVYKHQRSWSALYTFVLAALVLICLFGNFLKYLLVINRRQVSERIKAYGEILSIVLQGRYK